MIFQTAGNNNDWDGATNTGELIANAAAVLELRDNVCPRRWPHILATFEHPREPVDARIGIAAA